MSEHEKEIHVASEKRGAAPAAKRLADVRGGTNKNLHVGIVGAGICGLVAAYELEQLGCTSIILEADKNHVGGRLRTFRFDDGSYVEAGAMRIPEEHHLTRSYVSELGLTLRPFIQSNPKAVIRLRGQTRRKEASGELGSLFTSDSGQRPNDADAVWQRTISDTLVALSAEEIADLYKNKPQTKKIRDLDQLSLVGFLSSQGINDHSIEYLAGIYGIEAALHISLTEHLREEHEGVWVEKFDEVVGGMDQLASALQNKIKGPVQSGAFVKSIDQSSSDVRIGYTQDNIEKSISVDCVVVTAPLPVVRSLHFSPKLSGKKHDAIRRIFYDSSTKVIARSSRRFWEEDDGIFGGGSFHDDLLGSVWYPNDNLDQDPVISAQSSAFLASYSWGQLARRVPNQRSQIVDALAELHPSLRDNPSQIKDLRFWSWDRFPLTQGAYAFFRPGEHTSLFRELLRPEGRIYFAGEHASLAHSWIQGAIESALHAVEQITQGA